MTCSKIFLIKIFGYLISVRNISCPNENVLGKRINTNNSQTSRINTEKYKYCSFQQVVFGTFYGNASIRSFHKLKYIHY